MVRFIEVLTLSWRDWVERLPLMLFCELISGEEIAVTGALLHISYS